MAKISHLPAFVFPLLLFPFLSLLSHLIGASNGAQTVRRDPISIDDSRGTFVKDGRPFRYVSGSFHYWRTPRRYWVDRLRKMAASGLNAVQTYIPWHLHEPYPGEYRFDDELNLFEFFSLVEQEGLLAVIRPGPYIDNLNEFGGLPAWLLWERKKPPGKPMVLRTADPQFLVPVFAWFDALLPMLKPLLYPNGGPIFACQVENELGSYEPLSSEKYLALLVDRFHRHFAQDAVLFTTDGSSGWYLKYLQTPRFIFPTVDFGVQSDKKNVIAAFASQKAALARLGFGAGPLINSEYYPGWHDYWGRRYISVAGADAARTLDDILSLNASVNVFMFVGGSIDGFHGGTTIGDGGFYYTATTTWDYDAPVSEAGDPTEKLFLMREVLKKYALHPLPPVPPPSDKSDCAVSFSASLSSSSSSSSSSPRWKNPVRDVILPFGFVPLEEALRVLCPPDRIFRSRQPLSFEDLRQDYGYVLYRAAVKVASTGNLTAEKLRDRGLVYVNGIFVGEINRNGNSTIENVSADEGDVVDLLVENLGRKDYGVMTDDEIYKGLLTNVTLGSRSLDDWTMYSLPLNNTEEILNMDLRGYAVDFKADPVYGRDKVPGFFLYNFTMKYGFDAESDQLCLRGDAFFLMNHLKKGVLFLNGRNIGRYWTAAGPQQTLYIANPYLKFSQIGFDYLFNTAMVFETDGLNDPPTIPLLTKPILNGPWKPPNVTSTFG